MEESGFPVDEAPESVFRSVTEAEVSLDEMLSLACRQGKQDIVELLLESGANVNHRNKAGNTPLLEACSQGHVSIAQLLLDRNANIDAPTETTYDSALTWACTLGNEEIVALLLERSANVEHRTKDGCTALMFAALAGHERVAKLLLDHSAEINVESDSNKDSPLTFACWKGHQKVVELFLQRNADIEHRTKEGFSPLMFAALGGHTQVAELLLKHSAQVNMPSGSNNDIPLTSACWKGHHQVVCLLLRFNSNIEHRTKDGCTPLMLAAREGHFTVAQLLLEHGAKVNMPSGSENNIPLTLACWKGHRDVVELLLKHNSNIEHQNKAGCTPLMLAAREGHYEATLLLLNSGAQINVPSGSNDDTPLTLACWKGHENVVLLLIGKNSNVNHQTKTGCTPLMEATREGHVGVARMLLEAGADVETPDNYGQSPFFMACWKGHADVAALLLLYDANKDCRTKTGITPLFQACRENHVEVVKLLLDYGCNPSTPFPNSRECPLTLASEKGYGDLAQLLVARNANIESRTKKGSTPFFLACKEGYKDISVMLAKHGADTEATDYRGTTPLLSAFRSAHVELVDWLLGHVTHLPSDIECQRALVAPMPPDTDLLPRRSKSFEMIMKAKKAREQAALRNAQSLFEELDAEKERRESKKKAAAKKRSKRKEKKRREQAEKMEATQQDAEERLSVEGREEPDGESSLTPPHPSPSPQAASPTAERAADVPDDTSGLPPQKKRRSRKKRKKKDRAEEDPLTEEAEPDDSNDSADEVFHDAQSDLPDFYPPESLVTKQQSVIAVAPACIEAPPPTSDEKPSVAQRTPTTKGRIEEPPKTTTGVPDRERSSQTIHEKALKIIEDSKPVSIEEKNRSNKSIRPEKLERAPPKNQKCKSSKPEKSTAAVGATTTPTTITRKIEVLSSEQKVYPLSRSKNYGGEVSKQERSGSVKSSKEADIRESSSKTGTWDSKKLGRADTSVPGKQGEGLAWNKAVGRPQSDHDSLRVSPPPGGSHMTAKTNQIRTPSQPSNQTQSSFVAKSQQPESSWTSSQDSMSDWGEEEMDPEELQVISRCRTDDDKIRSQKLREAAVATVVVGTGTAVSRPAATTATPTPTVATTASSSTSQPWQEVTRTTRTVQLSVANTLVGRVIGRGGARINSIQEDSGAHINVSRNIPKSTERLITIKGTQRSVTRAQELIEEALSTPDREIDLIIPSPPPTVTHPPTSFPEGTKDNPPTPTPSLTHTSIRPSGQKKRNLDIVPPNPSEPRAPWTSSFQSNQNRSSTSSSTLPSRRSPVSVSAPTTVSESSSYISTNALMTARSSLSEEDSATGVSHESRPRVCAWQVVGEGTVISSRPGTRGTKSVSEEEGDMSRATSSLPASPGASDELSVNNCGRNQERDWEQSHQSPPYSFTPDPTSSAPASVSPLEDHAPSLSIHSRSKSDPQVSSEQIRERMTPAKWGNQALPVSQLSQTRHFSPSMPAISSPTTEEDRVPSLGESSESASEKVSANLKESAGSKVPSHGTMVGFAQSGTGGELSGVTKTTKNVAVIQPTQHHQVTVSSSTFPTTTQASATSNLPTVPSSRGYGAVVAGRRSSTPGTQAYGTVPSPHTQRKVSYAGLQWSHAPMRPISYLPTAMEGSPVEFSRLPPSGPHPPSASAWNIPHMAHTSPSSSLPPGWLSAAAEGERTRSFSWAGLPGAGGAGGPFASGGIAAYPAQVVPLYLPRPPSQEAPHPQTPDTPHGENLVGEPWSESDFSAPTGVYGAIGSGVRTTTSGAPGVKHAPIRGYASAPPNPSKPTAQGSDNIWSHPGSSNVVYPNPLASLHGFQQFSQQQHVPTAGRPFGSASTSVHMHARTVAGQKSHAPNWVSDSSSYSQAAQIGHQDNPSPSNPETIRMQKRWSVPSMTCTPQPCFQPNLARQPESQSWSSGHVHSQNTAAEIEHKAGYPSPGKRSLSDPWTNWGGDGTSASGGSGGGGGGGSSNTTNPTSVSSDTWQPSPLSPGQDSKSSRSKFRRGVAVGVAAPWSSSPLASQEDGGGASDLQQLMKSLDIAEHLHVLKDRKLSLQQLHSMSDEEWRSLKLPVGPRVKLINAVSNIARSGNGNKPPVQGSSTTGSTTEPVSPPESFSTTDVVKPQTDSQLCLQETFQ